MMIAREHGYEIEKIGLRLEFRRNRSWPLRHLSWATGMLAFLLTTTGVLFALFRLQGIENALPWSAVAIVGWFAFAAIILFVFVLRRYRHTRGVRPEQVPLRYVADLAAGELRDDRGRVLAPLARIVIRVKFAGDSYLMGEFDFIDKIVLRWGWFHSVCVFKSGNDDVIERVRRRLADEGCGRLLAKGK